MIIAPNNLVPVTDNQPLQVLVTKVFDGDGFLASPSARGPASGRRFPFRFAFIDAPETVQLFGHECRTFLSGLILRKTITIVPIFKQSRPLVPLDSYQRILCMGFLKEITPAGSIDYFWSGMTGRGLIRRSRSVIRNVELEMVVNGFAWVVRQYPFEDDAEYFAAEEDARKHRRGLWATNNPEPPWTFKARRKKREQTATRQSMLI